MKIQTIIIALLLLSSALVFTSCKSSDLPPSNEDIQKQLAKENKKKARQDKKMQKKAYKHFWSLQSKEVKKSVRQNRRRQKKAARKRRK
jgi:hypothetical protein